MGGGIQGEETLEKVSCADSSASGEESTFSHVFPEVPGVESPGTEPLHPPLTSLSSETEIPPRICDSRLGAPGVVEEATELWASRKERQRRDQEEPRCKEVAANSLGSQVLPASSLPPVSAAESPLLSVSEPGPWVVLQRVPATEERGLEVLEHPPFPSSCPQESRWQL